jgi:hypothetical protein
MCNDKPEEKWVEKRTELGGILQVKSGRGTRQEAALAPSLHSSHKATTKRPTQVNIKRKFPKVHF